MCCGKYSDFFEYLRQREIMSPILFSLLVDDLELFLQGTPDSGLVIDDIVLIILLFVDDMVIFGKTPQELQDNLDHLHSYCTKWGLKVNTDTTKLCFLGKEVGYYKTKAGLTLVLF